MQWFKPLQWWYDLFAIKQDYIIFHFHRPEHLFDNKQIQALPSAVIYREFSHTILDLDDEYEEAQRYIFAQNRCIPPKIWLGHYGSY